MEEILIELLKNNTKVIIPDFGAFIVKQRNPFQVVFNEFLRFNDGMLIDSISKKENISKEEAKEKINKWIELVKSSIEKNNSYEIKSLGKLIKTETGKIHLELFSISKEDKDIDENKDIELTFSKDNLTTEKHLPSFNTTNDKTSISKDEELKVASEKSIKTEIPLEKNKEKIKEKGQVLPPIEKTIKYREPILDTKRSTSIVTEDSSKISETKLNNMRSQKNKSKTGKLIKWFAFIIVFSLILSIAFIYSENLVNYYNKYFPIIKNKISSLFKYEKTKQITDNYKTESDVIKTQDSNFFGGEDNIKTVEENIATKNEENIVKETTKINNLTQKQEQKILKNKYYIVAGCFRDESNADACVIMLRNKGYPAEKFGKIGDLTAVSYASFDNKEEAIEMLRTIRNKESKDAWLFHY